MKRMMIDIESLSLGPRPKILQIGATTGKTEYVMTISQDDAPGKVDPATVAWWDEQPAEVRARVFAGEAHWEEAIIDFVGWVAGQGVDEVWAQGPQFDIVALEYYMSKAGIPRPWRYNEIRDLRTLRAVVDLPEPTIREGGELMDHDALCDARYQLRILNAILPAGECLPR